MKKIPFIPAILCVLLLIVFGLIVAQLIGTAERDSTIGSTIGSNTAKLQLSSGTALNPGKPIQEFELLDHAGQPFGLDRLTGQWTVLFFGFTNCPDICPTTMQFLKTIKNKLAASGQWQGLQVGFMTVDPARDTVEHLARYVPHFDPEFVGITGSIANVQAFAKQMSMPFILEEKDERGHYNVAHSASLLLISPEAELRGIISAPHPFNELLADLQSLPR